jgi:hypothetical protein
VAVGPEREIEFTSAEASNFRFGARIALPTDRSFSASVGLPDSPGIICNRLTVRMDEAICHIHVGRPCRGFRDFPAASMVRWKICRMGSRCFRTADRLRVQLSSIARDVVCGLAAVRQDASLAKGRDSGFGRLRGEHHDAAGLVARAASSSPTVDFWNLWSRSGRTLLLVDGCRWSGLAADKPTIRGAACWFAVNIGNDGRDP